MIDAVADGIAIYDDDDRFISRGTAVENQAAICPYAYPRHTRGDPVLKPYGVCIGGIA